MRIRDALESDAEALAGLADRPTDVMRDLVHDRTVRVAIDDSEGETGGAETDPDATEGDPDGDDADPDGDDVDEGDGRTPVGFVAFDAGAGTVHVTDFAGSASVTRRLFEEPERFAAREGMAVEVVVPDGDADGTEAAEAAGFESVDSGPRFEGDPTTRFRLDPGRDG